MSRVKKLSLAGMLTAAAVVILFIASVIPSGRIAVTAVAGFAVAAAVCSLGMGWALGCWVCSGALALLLMPAKGSAVLFALFFGLYPVIKSLIERLDRLIPEWALKLAFFLACLTVWYFFFRGLFSITFTPLLTGAVYVIGSVVFVLYDIAFSRLMGLYLARFGTLRRN